MALPHRRGATSLGLLLGALAAGALLVWLAPSLLVFALGSWVRGETGRTLSVERAAIHWGMETTLELSGVRLGNADWAREPWMVAIDHVRLRASPGDLLRGRGVVHALDIEGAALLLELNGARANWEFSRPVPFIAFGGGGLPHIESLRVRDVRVRFHDPDRESDITGAITGAAGSVGTPGWGIGGQGTLDHKALRFQVQSEGPDLHVSVDLGATSLLARGTPGMPGLFVHAEGNDLREAFPLIPIPFPSTPAYRFDARLIHDGARAHLRAISGMIGDTDFSGELTVTFAATPSVAGRLHSHTLHAGDLKGFLGVPVRGPPPRPGKLFPANPINRNRFSRLYLALDYHADDVAGGPVPLSDVATRVTIDAGRLALNPLRIAIADGAASGSAGLDVRGGTPHAAVDLELKGGRLSEMVAELPLLDASRGRVRGALRLQGAGESLADIFDASHGEMVLLMDDGALDRRFVDALSGDVLRLLFSEPGQETALGCAVAVFDVASGVARADALVVETSQALITGSGEVDLGRERLNLTLAAEPTEAKALSAPTPLTLAGTLAEPKLELDTSELAGRAAAAITLGALLGPLAAVVPFATEGEEGDGGCDRLLQRITQQQG